MTQMRPRKRMRRSLTAVAALLATAALLAACTSHRGPAALHGQATPLGPAPTAALPPGEGTAVHVTATSASTSPSNDLLSGEDRQIGPAYDFTVAKEPSSALISFTVDPAKLAASVGVPGASPAGLYIQIYEPALGSWIPLESTYDPSKHTVTATAPHLSYVSLGWTDIKCAVECPARLFAKAVNRFASDIVDNIKQAWSPKQEQDECAKSAAPDWTVRSSIKQLSGCIVDGGSSLTAQEQNPLLLPMRVWQPAGAQHASVTQQPYMTGGHPDLTALIAGLIDWTANATLLPPREYGVVPVTAPASGTKAILTQPDTLGLVMDVIQSVLFALPGEKSEDEAIENAVKAVLPDFEQKMEGQPGSVSLSEILAAVHGNVEQQEAAAPGPVLTYVDTLSTAYECATSKVQKAFNDGSKDGITNAVLEAAIEIGKSCVESGIEAAGKEESHSLKAVLGVLDSIPNFAKTIREGVQFAELGPSAMQGTTTITREQSVQFQAFGLTVENFMWSAANGQIAITPPLGADEYSALWGVFDGQRRCSVTVDMDSALNDPQADGNFGFAIAPLSSIESDQPVGASVQYEHEAPPDFPAAGSFVRPAQLPGGAWHVDVSPIAAPDIAGLHHIHVTDDGQSMTIKIDGHALATYSHEPECGGVGIRVWGAGFTFSNLQISD
jgi:hypothetical protein